jgi:uncharacterized protein (TIGR01777 family)
MPGQCCPDQNLFLWYQIKYGASKLTFEGEGIHLETAIGTTKAGRKLLSGASGMLGAALQTWMRADGAEIVQLVRREPEQIGELRWDPSGEGGFAETETLEGLSAAIHLSGANLAAHRWTPAYRREIAASRVDSTRALATALAGLRNPPPVLLVASATGIYGDRGDEVLTEDSELGTGFLAEVCRAWEAAARPAVEAGIRVVHLRFGVVLAAGAGALGKMTPLFRLGLAGRLGSGGQWMSWIALEDLTAAVGFILKSPEIVGAVNLTAPHPVTNSEFTRAMGRVLHRPALLPAPAFALRLAVGQMADEALLSSARVMPSRLTAAGFQFARPTIESALAAALRR